jgi:ABC-type polar amino acid transport system ATPase subunit
VESEPARVREIETLGAAVALVSPDLPMRVNLTGGDNVALGWQYHDRVTARDAIDRALRLLADLGHPDAAHKRDEDMSPLERFAVKLARAHSLARARLVIDRPALLLPDVFYPEAVRALALRLPDPAPDCVVVDFAWNKALWETIPPA